MQFEKEHIYHIYNQGNNKRKIFFNQRNYYYFQQKINTYITPYADIIAYCLMPNHFHLMVVVKHEELEITDTFTHGVTSSHPVSKRSRTFNQSIAIILRSYTRAINKQEGFTGALFRESTKAECVDGSIGVAPSFIIKNGISNAVFSNPEKEHLLVCFNYIHQNPVRAGLVKSDIDWEFSSAKDYAEIKNDSLISKVAAKKYLEL